MQSSRTAARSPDRCRDCGPSARPCASCGARSPKPFGKPEMLQIGFRGWFQCRLATDPDPFDEPRGVSGYVHAYVDEPNLDRIIRFQTPAFVRPLSPEVSVCVDKVLLNGAPQAGTALAGAKVSLLGSPVFEGRNGVVSEGGFEPVFPFDLSIEGDGASLRRAVVPADPSYPFEGLLAPGV